jgi:hypothetical protein
VRNSVVSRCWWLLYSHNRNLIVDRLYAALDDTVTVFARIELTSACKSLSSIVVVLVVLVEVEKL